METLERYFNARIGAFLDRTGMPPTTFGMKAVGDPNLLRQIESGRSVTLRLADQALAFINEYDKEPGTARAPPYRRRIRGPAPEASRTRRDRAMSEESMEQRTGPPIRFLRMPEVVARTGLAASTIRDWVAAGHFPQPVSLGSRAKGWIEAEITEWSRGRIAASRGAAESGAR